MSTTVSSIVHEREQGKEWPWNIDVVLEFNSVHNFFLLVKKYWSKEKHSHMNGRQGARPVALPVARRWSELHIRTPNTFLLAFSLPAGATFGK